jgi:hypothetical protein
MRFALKGVSRPRDPVRATDGYTVDPSTSRAAAAEAECAQPVDKRARTYVLVSIWLVFWAILHLYVVVAVFSNAVLLLSYYAVNYRFGFVRRGLGGELIRIFPDSDYFIAAYTILWTSTIVWLIALVVLMWLICSSGITSERRVMLALLVPVLPFSYSYAVYNSHPEIWGMTALLAFSIALWRARNLRFRIIASTLYGITMAVLALIHEAIPLEFALGAVLAIVVLSKGATQAAKRICGVLAVGPGIVSVSLVAMLGRRDIASRLCAQVPHGMVDDPRGLSTTPHKALHSFFGHLQGRSDFHDWVCTKVILFFDLDMHTAVRVVASYGFLRLLGSFLIGLLFFVGTLSTIRYMCGVPGKLFLGEIRNNLVMAVLAVALLVPLFATALDWTRWWVMMTLDVAIVYIFYAIHRPEIEQAPSKRNVLVFVAVAIVLAVIPIGDVNNVGG